MQYRKWHGGCNDSVLLWWFLVSRSISYFLLPF